MNRDWNNMEYRDEKDAEAERTKEICTGLEVRFAMSDAMRLVGYAALPGGAKVREKCFLTEGGDAPCRSEQTNRIAPARMQPSVQDSITLDAQNTIRESEGSPAPTSEPEGAGISYVLADFQHRFGKQI